MGKTWTDSIAIHTYSINMRTFMYVCMYIYTYIRIYNIQYYLYVCIDIRRRTNILYIFCVSLDRYPKLPFSSAHAGLHGTSPSFSEGIGRQSTVAIPPLVQPKTSHSEQGLYVVLRKSIHELVFLH